MKKILLTLDDAERMVEGLRIYLKGLYGIGEIGRSIQVVQGHLGQVLTARTYLEKGHKVWWVHPDYDLDIEGIGNFEVKTAKCWRENGKSDANVFGLEKELDKFDKLSLVLIDGDNEPFKILCIPKGDLKECKRPHTFKVNNNQSPCFVYYNKEGLKHADEQGDEVYSIERRIALNEEEYL